MKTCRAKLRIWGRAGIVLAPLLFLASCKKETPSGEPTVTEVNPSAPELNERLVEQVQAIASTCEIGVQEAVVRCAEGQLAQLTGEYLRDAQARGRVLPTLTHLLGSSDPKVRVSSSVFIYDAFRAGFGEATKVQIEAPVAQGLIEATLKLPPNEGRLVAPLAVHTAVLAGITSSLYPSFDVSPVLAASGYRFLLTHGRLDAFEKVRSLAEDSRSAVRLAALEAPRNMARWSPKDRAAICPWAVGFLNDERPLVASRAAVLLGRCSGEPVDQLLISVETQLQKQTLDASWIPALRELCSPTTRTKETVSSEQNQKVRRTLEKIAESSKLDEKARLSALSTSGYCWPDQEMMRWLRRLGSSPSPAIAKSAQDVQARVSKRLDVQASAVSTP